MWLENYEEFCEDDVTVQYWNDRSIDDPVYAFQFHRATDAWIIADMKTILEMGL